MDFFAALGLVLVTIGCARSDPRRTEASAASTAVSEYQLTRPGAACTYLWEVQTAGADVEARVILLEAVGTRTLDGRETVLWRRTESTETNGGGGARTAFVYQAVDGATSETLAFSFRQETPPRRVRPYVDLHGPVRAGTTWTFDGDLPSDLDTDGRPLGHRTVSTIEEDDIALDVPAGRFNRCVRTVSSGRGTDPALVDCGATGPVPGRLEYETTRWFCPAVGEVRSEENYRVVAEDGTVCSHRAARAVLAGCSGLD